MSLCWALIAASKARHRQNPYEYPETLFYKEAIPYDVRGGAKHP